MRQLQYFFVDYYYQKQGTSARTRTSMTGSVSQHLYGGSTENAVLNYLKKKHFGFEVTMLKLTWK